MTTILHVLMVCLNPSMSNGLLHFLGIKPLEAWDGDNGDHCTTPSVKLMSARHTTATGSISAPRGTHDTHDLPPSLYGYSYTNCVEFRCGCAL